MARVVTVDNRLYDIIMKAKDKLVELGCQNPSYSNALRSLMDMPHIDGHGHFDKCGERRRITIRDTAKKEEPVELEMDIKEPESVVVLSNDNHCTCGALLMKTETICYKCGKRVKRMATFGYKKERIKLNLDD